MEITILFIVIAFITNNVVISQIQDGKNLLNRSILSLDSNDYYHVSNYEFKCVRQLAICSSHGWSLKLQLRLNEFQSRSREHKYLLFSTGAHESHGDGMLIYLYQLKDVAYLEFGLKEFVDDQFAFYWQIEADLEINKWVEIIITVEKHTTSSGQHFQMKIFFDGYLYKETEIENYKEISIFRYKQIHPKATVIYGNNSGLAMIDNIIYYERILSDEDIANVSLDIIALGCLKSNDRVHQYIIAEVFDDWKLCRDKCSNRKMKIALYSSTTGQCGCVQSSLELDTSFNYDKECNCSLNELCSNSEEWHVLVVSRIIDLVDTEVGLDIRIADATFLNQGRTRVQRNEGVEMIVSVKNERNLAALTVYGDIEGQEFTHMETNSSEMYITPGVVSLSWKNEGSKKVNFRADYRRMVNDEMSEYRTVYVDVVYVKTDLPLKCVHLSSDNRDGHPYQNFTVQTYGSIPINCTIDFGDGDRKTNVTNRHQYYTAYFSKNYTRYGQYNISTQCYNELSVNTARIIRTVRRENMNKKMIIHKNLAETSEATRFYLTSRDDYACQHTSHLRLRNAITNETMKLIQRKKMLEVIPDESLPAGKHLYQLACGSASLQPYSLNIQPAIRSLDVEPSKSTIKSGQTVEFSITLQPTLDLTAILDCGASKIPLEIIHIEQTTDLAPILIGSCTYSTPGQYYPLISAMNHINSVNQSVHINVDPPLSQFEVDIEDLLDINELTVTIRALEKTSYEGVFTLTIINNINERNQTMRRPVQLLESNNFTEQLDVNITTYGQQILHVRGEDFPTIREAQARFTVGTKITKKPQVYIINQLGLANKDFIWVDIQWINGVGFDIEIDYGNEKKVVLHYGQFISNAVNRIMKKIDGIHHLQWKITAKQRLQIGYRYPKSGTYKIDVTFIQPTLELMRIGLKCSTVTIVDVRSQEEETCFQEHKFYLSSLNSLNQINSSSSVLLLPHSLQHKLEPTILTNCSNHDFIYSFYLLFIDPSLWKHSRVQRYSYHINQPFEEKFIDNYCSEFGSKSILALEPKSLSHGYYLYVFTIGRDSSMVDFRQYIQPIEITRSDLITKFGGNETIKNNNEEIHLDFYLRTMDPDNELERRKLNFTLICYPEQFQSLIFQPNIIRLGSSRPTEANAQNINEWSIQWSHLNLILHRSELNLQFYENQCFSSNVKNDKNRKSIQFNSDRKTLTINEKNLMFDNGILHFLLIVRHLNDGRQLIASLEVDKQLNFIFDTTDLSALEDIMNNLEDLASSNPKQAVELITGVADRLNQMSDNNTSENTNEAETKTMNDRMASMRSKMLTSMNTVFNSVDDPNTVDKALKASATVTANSDQMPLNNQEKGADIIEKVGTKVKDMNSTDDETVTNLATSLLNVGGNVLQAASRTVSKDKENNPDAVIENLESDMKVTENEETDTKVLYAPTQFYDACDECETLPEDRWEEFRHKLAEEKKTIIEGRERASNIAKRSSDGLFTVGDTLVNRSSINETKTIESKTMTMTFTKASPDGKSSLSVGDTNIRLPDLSDLNFGSDSSEVFTKILESKNNPFASTHGNTSVQGSVVTIILSGPDGSEMSVKNTTKPISIRLTRPIDKQPQYQQYDLQGKSFQYHKVNLPEKQMTLSVYLSPNSSSMDTYAVFVSFGVNETALEPPTESKFDLLFIIPNQTVLESTIDIYSEDEHELRHTIFMPPSVHLGNGTYIFGVKLLDTNMTKNLTEHNSGYTINMYVSKCQYWDEKRFIWSSDGCEVGSLTTLKSTECLCTHLTTFGSDFFIPPNKIDFTTVFKKFKTLHENAAVFSTVIGIFSLYILAAIWARRKDKLDLIKWTATPLIDNLPIDTYHYLLTVHTGFGKESGTTSNISFVISGESSDSGMRKLTDGKIKEFSAGSIRNYVMSVESPLGPLLYLRVWHDNSGVKERASWFLNMINVLDLQTGEKSYFICNDWLAVEKGDGLVDRIIPLASSKELKNFSHLFTESVKKKLSDAHLWFSVFSRPVRSNFTRLQRISCCISLLFCTMISNAMFYRQDTQTMTNKSGVLLKIGPLEFTLTQVLISFFGTLVVLPINIIIITLFRKAKYSQKTLVTYQLKKAKYQNKSYESNEQHKKTISFFSKTKSCCNNSKLDQEEIERINAIPSIEDKTRTLPHWLVYVAWILVILSILTSSFFVILYSLEWGAQRANEWLITMMLSFGQSILIIDPLKVFLITAILSCLIRRPYNDETLDFDDPFTGALLAHNNLTHVDYNDEICNEKNFKKIAIQRRVHLFDLRPIDSKEMGRAREQRLREIKMGQIIREIIIYVFFTVVLLFLSYQSRDTNSHGLYRDTKHLFITENFNDVTSIDAWWDYCNNILLKGLYAQPWYNNKNLTWREKLTTATRVSMRVGAPRIRQLRVKDNSCRIHRRFKHIISHCRNDYNWFDDDTKHYTSRWETVLDKNTPNLNNETNNQEKRCKTPWCYQSSIYTKSDPLSAIYKTYKGGGYVVSLGRTYEKALSVLDELHSQNWLDQLTRAVIIDFSLYNANVNLFVAVTLSFEMTSMGSVIQDHRIKVFRLYDHIGSYGLIVYIFELFFIIFTIYSIVHETSLIIKHKRGYFRKFWNVTSFLTAIFSIIIIIMYGTKKALTRLAIRSLKKTEMGEFVNFNAIGSFDEVYSYIVALITFFTMLKFLKLLRFNRRVGMLSKSFSYAQKDLISFGFVFLIFMLAYAQMGFAIFGRSLRSFRNLFNSLTTCFRMLLGEINAPAMIAVSRVYGAFFYLSFVILVFIALLSIFITILNDSFARVKRELIAKKYRNEMMDFMWSAFRKIVGLNNQKKSKNEKEKEKERMPVNSMNETNKAPLATADDEEI
ncbi:unnamed protein product [Rotaria socialis]|uniref:Polycystic kidney disease protein 1-like 2 n=1 Tax=Rotaria socialis TaxID=392032 RepID=A0A820PG69_9BILA|nr:unnamed protein product [Rotaria socialis]